MASRGKGKEKEKAAAAAPPSPEPAPEREVVPGKMTESEWLHLLSLEESSSVVAELVGEVVEMAHSIVYAHYLESQAFPHSTQQAKRSLLQIIDWQFLTRDEGERDTATDPSWTEDEEPVPAVIDSWARGIIPQVSEHTLNSHTPPPCTTPPLPPSPPHSDRESKATSTLPADATVSVLSSSTREPSQRKQVPKHHSRPVARHQNARMVVLPHPPPPPSSSSTSHRPTLTAEEKASLHSCTPLSSLDRSHADHGPPKPLPYNMRPAQLHWQKDVSYDERGNILSMTRLDPAHFPSHSVKPRVQILPREAKTSHARKPHPPTSKTSSLQHSTRVSEAATGMGGRKRGRGRGTDRRSETVARVGVEGEGGGGGGGGGGGRGGGGGVRESRRFPEMPTLPSLVDTVDPQPGVVVREAGRIIRGPCPLRRAGPASPPAHMQPMLPLSGRGTGSIAGQTVSIT